MKIISFTRCKLKILALLLSWLPLCGLIPAVDAMQASADPLVMESPAPLLRQLVETAITYDLYNARCRGYSTAINTANLNKLLIHKYSLTINQVIQNVTSKDQSTLKKELDDRLVKKISEFHGCKEAKRQGVLQNLQQTYRDLLQRLEEQP